MHVHVCVCVCVCVCVKWCYITLPGKLTAIVLNDLLDSVLGLSCEHKYSPIYRRFPFRLDKPLTPLSIFVPDFCCPVVGNKTYLYSASNNLIIR